MRSATVGLRRAKFGSAIVGLLAMAWAGALSMTGSAAAQPIYPSHPVRIVVPSAAGGGIDIVARGLAEPLSKATGQQFYVENRAGAGNMLGIDLVAKSAPDGYTLLVTASPLTINHLTYKNISYDAVRDFAPISLIVSVPSVLVTGPGVPFASLADLIAEARRHPGQLTYASAGLGTNPHMAMELLKSMAGIDLRHVAYRGVGPALIDVIGGSVDCMIAPLVSAKAQIDGGSVRVLATTGLVRAEVLPAIPTFAEAGVPGYETMQWYGILAPSATPPAIVAKLHALIAAALQLAEVRNRLEVEGGVPVGSTPAQFTAFIAAEMAKWGEVAKAANLLPGSAP